MQPFQSSIEAALRAEHPLAAWQLAAAFEQRNPSSYVLVTQWAFESLDRFAASGACVVHAEPALKGLFVTAEDSNRLSLERSALVALDTVLYEGARLELLRCELSNSSGVTPTAFLAAPTRAIAERFFAAYQAFEREPGDDMLVFDHGGWVRDPALRASIRASTFEGLVLEPQLGHALLRDFERFFAARELYRSMGVPWKRGALLLGPPGNGKTHAIKALVNHLEKPCLYVRSFQSSEGPQMGVSHVFARARRIAPVILVLEDLDALVTDANRSYFLNELDGFGENDGLVVLASTNHPEQLDTALLDRPSRFDRKYQFGLPALRERQTYLARWFGTRPAGAVPSDEVIARVAAGTDGYSFAYLKELCMSTLMAWVDAGDTDAAALDRALLEQARSLRAQMNARTVRGFSPRSLD